MKTYYWLAVNGKSCAISPGPLPITLVVKPVPQLLVGFENRSRAKEERYFFRNASIQDRKRQITDLIGLAQTGTIVIIKPSHPEPPIAGPTRWDAREVPKRGLRVSRTAYHEAGHATAWLYQGLPFTEVHISPDPQANLLGSLVIGPFNPYKLTPDDLEKLILGNFAGPMAEAQYTGRLWWPRGSEDFDNAFDLAMIRQPKGSYDVIETFLKYVWFRTHDFVKHSVHWTSIVAVAEALNERQRLSFEDVQTVISDATREEEVPVSDVEIVQGWKESVRDALEYEIRRRLRSLR